MEEGLVDPTLPGPDPGERLRAELGENGFEPFSPKDLEDFLFDPGARVELQIHGGVELVRFRSVGVVQDGDQLICDEGVRL
ncbi:hypothetical protein OG562_19390 [Streptomyces sp. NBC_01275]|uniref:hypothetical protein n=1 Tax=Streptomyces sp. NBC_01275 TaxID=2903807 RepID=UPI00225562D9|nr:hypothetical protein [Streptomyces sp. NBC_01275]MCX4763104.1 hypothetical protein [Streptomyces sp. NBC_01275]